MPVIDEVKEIIRDSDNIVFLGGAGVSTASGIADFRSATGLYNRENDQEYSPEYMLSHTFYKENPEEFTRYYKNNLIHPHAKPNKAHLALAEMERQGKLRTIITQNIDGLHQKAGSNNVIEIHGNLTDYYCVDCGKEYGLEDIMETEGLDRCRSCNGIIRPDIVLYEEGLDMDKQMKSIRAISLADVLIVGGTSLVVYPVAGYLNYYKSHKLILINRDETPQDYLADYLIHDDIGEVLEELANNN